MKLDDAVVSDARPRLGVLGYLLLGLSAFFLAVSGVVLAQGAVGPAIASLVLPLPFAYLAWLSRKWWMETRRRVQKGRVDVGPEGVALDGRPLVARKDIAMGLVRVAPATLKLALRGGGSIEIETFDADRARTLLGELGLGPSDQAAAIPLNVAARGAAFGVLPFFSLLLAADAARVGAVFGTAAFAVATLLNAYSIWRTLKNPSRVEVGLDAVLVHRTLRGSRAIELGRIRTVVPHRNGLSITLDDDTSEQIRCTEDEAALVAERVKEALAAREYSAEPPGEALLARNDRPLDVWLTTLRGLLQRDEPGYRQYSLDAPTLLRIAEDPHSHEETRVAAAVALGPKLDDAQKKRLRVAAETAVAPKLRVALEAAADGEDEKLEEALAELSDRASARS